jgi:hypothetical protein
MLGCNPLPKAKDGAEVTADVVAAAALTAGAPNVNPPVGAGVEVMPVMELGGAEVATGALVVEAGVAEKPPRLKPVDGTADGAVVLGAAVIVAPPPKVKPPPDVPEVPET